MKRINTLTAAAGAAVAALCLPVVAAGTAGADQPSGHGDPSDSAAVFVQTNDMSGNQIVSYTYSGHEGLRQVSRVGTGGRGVALTGAVVDDLASQGGLASDPAQHLLVAVNGGSNTITEFRTVGPYVGFRGVTASGGTTPVSVAVRGDLIYVLNAGGAGEVQGFYADTLRPIPGSARSLGLTPGLTPQFLNTPGEIGFSPSGRQLVVTTKANTSDIDVFAVGSSGSLSSPTVNPSATPVPFGFTFDRFGHLVVTEAGTSAVTSYAVNPTTGVLTRLGSLTDGLAALCWVTGTGEGLFFGSNAGSAAVTAYTVGASGQPVELGATKTDAGPIDLATSPDGSALFVETGGSDLVDSFAVTPSGTLRPTGTAAPELPGHSGLEGIAVG